MKYEKMEIKRLKSQFGQKIVNLFFLNMRSCARGGKKFV